MSEHQDDLSDTEYLAAQFALGILEEDERAQAEALMQSDIVFLGMVDAWTQRLAKLHEGLPPVEPSAEVWGTIQKRLERDEGRAVESGSIEPVVASAVGKRELIFWQGWALAASIGVVALGSHLWMNLQERATDQPTTSISEAANNTKRFIAVLDDGEQGGVMVVTLDLENNEIQVEPMQSVTTPSQSLELWIIDDTGAKSAGLLDGASKSRLIPPVILRDIISARPLLAVSREPSGGSPTGQPTGPVVLKGRLLPIDVK